MNDPIFLNALFYVFTNGYLINLLTASLTFIAICIGLFTLVRRWLNV